MSHESQTLRGEGGASLRIPGELVGKTLEPVRTAEDAYTDAEEAPTVSEPREMSRPESTSEFAEAVHNYVRQYISLADTKAAFTFTVSTTLLAFLYQQNVSSRWIKPPSTWGLGDILGFIAMLCLAGGSLVSLAVIVPRLKGSKRGYVFWGAIVGVGSPAKYAEEVLQRSSNDLVKAKLEHCYELASVCTRKYRTLNLAIRIGALGLSAGVLYLLFFKPPS